MIGVFLSTLARSCFSHSRCSVAHLEGALPVVVEPGHDRHALLGRVALGRPEVLLDHAVQHDEVDALVIEGVVVGPEHLLPLVAHVEVPVVLADHHPHRRLEILQDLLAERELVGPPELRQVAAVEHEIRLRIECVHVLHGLQRKPSRSGASCRERRGASPRRRRSGTRRRDRRPPESPRSPRSPAGTRATAPGSPPLPCPRT